MKRWRWMVMGMTVGLALLAAAFVALLEVYDQAEAAAELSCLASIGVALDVMPSGELARFSEGGTQWRALGKGERTWLLESAAKAGSLDCRSRRHKGFFDRRYSEPEIAVRRRGEALEFRLQLQAAPRFYEIGGGNKTLLREVKVRL